MQKRKKWLLPVLRSRVPHQAALLPRPFWGEEGKMRLERKIKDQEEIQGIGRRGAVASGNNGFLADYKLSVQFKFCDSSLLS